MVMNLLLNTPLANSMKITAKDIALIGMMVAVIEVCKVAMMGIPNVELTTFWIIMFSIFFGRKIFFVIPVFILIEGAMFGFGIWWVMYLYMWPSLAVIVIMFRKMDSAVSWSILSGVYGLLFGFFCAIPYVIIGLAEGGIANGLYAGFTFWIAGIPWDLVHGVANVVIMLVLYKPIRAVMIRLKREWEGELYDKFISFFCEQRM